MASTKTLFDKIEEHLRHHVSTLGLLYNDSEKEAFVAAFMTRLRGLQLTACPMCARLFATNAERIMRPKKGYSTLSHCEAMKGDSYFLFEYPDSSKFCVGINSDGPYIQYW